MIVAIVSLMLAVIVLMALAWSQGNTIQSQREEAYGHQRNIETLRRKLADQNVEVYQLRNNVKTLKAELHNSADPDPELEELLNSLAESTRCPKCESHPIAENDYICEHCRNGV